MKTLTRSTLIPAESEKVFSFMDDYSKTGMHMTESSTMMMGSKLQLEQLSPNATGIGATYRWFGKMMGMTIDFTQTVSKWVQGVEKEWKTNGDVKIIIMGWYRMFWNLKPVEGGTLATIGIDYSAPREWYFKVLSFLFGGMYSRWCLNSMLRDTKKAFETPFQPHDASMHNT
jgi:hypothetical protein